MQIVDNHLHDETVTQFVSQLISSLLLEPQISNAIKVN
jgi:hypothetical protein